MKLTGAAILVSRGTKVLQAAPAAYPYRSVKEAKGMTKDQIIAIVSLGFGGLCFLSLGLLLFVPVVVSRHFRQTAVRGVGVVFGYCTEERNEAATLHHPHVRYTDASGAEQTATVRGIDRRLFESGQQVEILYNASPPRRVQIVGLDGYGEMRFICFWMTVAGLACVLMSVAIWAFRIPVNQG
jgi:hypothetical protein